MKNKFYTVFLASEKDKFGRSFRVSLHFIYGILIFGIAVIGLAIIGFLRFTKFDELSKELDQLRSYKFQATHLLIDAGIKNNVGVLVRVPDASGILTGKVNVDTKIDEKDHRSVRKGEWIKASLKKVEQLRPIAESNGLTITELAIKFILSKKGISSVFPTVISEDEIGMFSSMSDGKYLNDSDLRQIDELYANWWDENPYELKATPQTV